MDVENLLPLEEALSSRLSAAETVAFLQLLLTRQELKAFRHRWQAFQLTLAGHSQREIRDILGVSIITAARAARVARDSPEIVEMVLSKNRSPAGC